MTPSRCDLDDDGDTADAALSSSAMAEGEIHAALPRLYRRAGGPALSRYLTVAQALVDGARALFERARRADPRRELAQRGLDDLWPAEHRAAGTALELRSWVGRDLPPPRIWSGVRLEPEGGDTLRARAPATRRAVVLAWSREDLGRPPEGFSIPDAALAVGVSFQAVVLEAVPPRRAPVPGKGLRGRVFWERPR
jgi:hypothetical protein